MVGAAGFAPAIPCGDCFTGRWFNCSPTLPRLVWAERAARSASGFQNRRSSVELRPEMGGRTGLAPVSLVSQTKVLASRRPFPNRCWRESNPRLLRWQRNTLATELQHRIRWPTRDAPAAADSATSELLRTLDEIPVDETNAVVSLIIKLKTKAISAKRRLNIIPIENMLMTMTVIRSNIYVQHKIQPLRLMAILLE